MPRKTLQAKARCEPRRSSRRIGGDLGETDASALDDNSSLVDSEESENDSESFQSPVPNDATDYGLEFTTSRIRSQDTPRHCSTLRKQTSLQRRSHRQETSTVTDDENIENSSRHANRNRDRRPLPEPSPMKSKPKTKRKQINPMRRQIRLIREIQRLQNSTDMLIPKLPFSRLVRELLSYHSREVTRITMTALEALQTATEMYVTQRLEDSYLLTIHRGRVTLEVRDMLLVAALRSIMN